MAFARIVADLGWDRVGLVYVSNPFGFSTRRIFEEACANLGIDVVATISFAHGLNMASSTDNRSLTDTAANMRRLFLNVNVKVYLVVATHVNAISAINLLQRSGMYGPGYTVLLPSSLTPPASGLPTEYGKVWMDLVSTLAPIMEGCIGVQPFYDPNSRGGQTMRTWWPQNQSAFDDLLAQSPQGSYYNLSEPLTPELSVWAHHVWDATMLAAHSVARAIGLCSVGDGLDTSCLLRIIRNETVFGTTGDILLDANGDRLGTYVIFNSVNNVQVEVGQVQFLGSEVNQTMISISKESIVWSDGSTNRSVGPNWGQDTHAPTTVPTIPPTDSTRQHSGSNQQAAAIYTGLGIVAIISFFIAVIVWRRFDEKRKDKHPANFKRILERLLKYGKLGGLGLDHEQQAANLDASTLEIPPELRRNDVILAEVIGKGQFGNVSRGVWTTHVSRSRVTVPVAVKMMQDNDHRAMAAQFAFLEEAAVTWQFDHDNVIKMYGVVTSGFPYLLVLELCENGALLSHVKERDQRASHLVQILHGIAMGMAYLASKHFVHRDLAARNVVLDSENRPKISDFGLGRCVEGDDYYRLTSDTLLPLRWTDPVAVDEQVFSEATDVWAFGVTAIEIFTRGARPYGEWSNLMVLQKLKEGFRLSRPATMPLSVYTRVVFSCWAGSSNEQDSASVRPRFSELSTILSQLLENDLEDHVDYHPTEFRDAFAADSSKKTNKQCYGETLYIHPCIPSPHTNKVTSPGSISSRADSGLTSVSPGDTPIVEPVGCEPYAVQNVNCQTVNYQRSHVDAKLLAEHHTLQSDDQRTFQMRPPCRRQATAI